MCNGVKDAVWISKSGYGWKLFKPLEEGKYGALCGEPSYFNINFREVVVGLWLKELGFCFFLSKEVAETWADYWEREGFKKPRVLKIQYWGGKGRRMEERFIGWRGGVEIALCNSFRIVDKKERAALSGQCQHIWGCERR